MTCSISTKIQHGSQKLKMSKFFRVTREVVLSTLWVQNLDKIALSLMIYKINDSFHFHQNSRWQPKFGQVQYFPMQAFIEMNMSNKFENPTYNIFSSRASKCVKVLADHPKIASGGHLVFENEVSIMVIYLYAIENIFIY